MSYGGRKPDEREDKSLKARPEAGNKQDGYPGQWGIRFFSKKMNQLAVIALLLLGAHRKQQKNRRRGIWKTQNWSGR